MPTNGVSAARHITKASMHTQSTTDTGTACHLTSAYALKNRARMPMVKLVPKQEVMICRTDGSTVSYFTTAWEVRVKHIVGASYTKKG